MQGVAPGKMIASYECAALPDPTKGFEGDTGFAPRLHAIPWFQGERGNPSSWVNEAMNCPYAVNMEDLP
jgi:hypothetical protein